MTATDIVIVGGGVIGLSIAYALEVQGVSCTVLDRGAMGRAASWAGAGILSPGGERPPTHPMAALRARSASLFPEWSAALRETTGIDNGYRRSGGVDVAFDEAEEQSLKAIAGRWREEGIVFERLGDDFGRVEPLLNRSVRTAYFLPDRAQIRNPRHLRALERYLADRGSVLRPETEAVAFDIRGDRVTAIRTPRERLACGQVVIAAGPWSGGLVAALGMPLETPPIRGQIVLLRTEAPRLRRIVEHGPRYLVPRDDGRILVGSTEEAVGFDARTTAEAVGSLIAEAVRLCPSLANAEVERVWAGLRPGSGDARPWIGPVPGRSNVLVATGHRRAGLQLSPATAELVADLILGRTPRIDPQAFRLDREELIREPDAFRS